MKITDQQIKRSIYNKSYRDANRERLNAYTREWRIVNSDLLQSPAYREERNRYSREWYEENKEQRTLQRREYDRKTAEQRHKRGKSAFGRYLVVKRRHGKRWSTNCLSQEDFTIITEQPCAYCGQETIGGLDRVDNLLGYEKQNVVSCCKVCNYMKNKLSLEDFKKQIERVYKKLCV